MCLNLLKYVEIIENKDETFGNARWVRNLFEKLIGYQSNRVISLSNITVEDLQTLKIVDVNRALSEKKNI